MISAYRWQVRSFLGAMAALLVVQIVLLSAGTLAVLQAYNRRESVRLETEARQIILNGPAETVPHDGPFFVFSADGSITYSNRGRGRSISENDMRPVLYEGTVVGYYYAEQVRFLSRTANRFVLTSIGVLVLGSTLMGLVIAGAAARRTGRQVADSLSRVRSDLHSLKALRPVTATPFDVEELSQISENLHSVSVELFDQEEYKRRWMQDISHDLRTPLTGLRSQLEGMRDGVFPVSEARLERTLADVARMESMVGSITELHALETTKTLETAAIASTPFVDRILNEWSAGFTQAEAHLSAHVESAVLYANESLLRRAVDNILSNALRYGGTGVSVELRLFENNDGSTLSICNDGPGVPEDQLPRLFQRFFRGEFGRSTHGAGLGLSIAHEIVVLHDGTLAVHNEKPRGVCFEIALPVPE